MNVEENRLQTFGEWPANAPIDATRLARAGFYYSGQALKVKCFLCGIEISDWNYGDQAITRHREAAPDCFFIQNQIPSALNLQQSHTYNVPLVPRSSAYYELISTFTNLLSRNNDRDRDLCDEQRGEFNTFFQRLKTFESWPIPSIVSPEKLAKAGFYYLLHEDVVQCEYCKGVLSNWKSGDDPDKEHRIHFPKCDFYLHQDADDTLYLNNVKLMPGTTLSLTELGIQTHAAPKQPHHATYEERLRTFYGWPENLKQTPEILARAGFFYTGLRDLVRCFHCDGGLRDWEVTDDVWTEHARWFPKCEFVNLIRGRKFIQECIDNRPPLLPSIFEGVPEEERTNRIETSPAPTCAASSSRQEATEAEEIETLHTNSSPQIEDDLSSKRLLYHRISKQGDDNHKESCNDNEATNHRQDLLNEKNDEPISDKKENSEPSDAEENASLEEENRTLKEARLCKICMDREVAIVFLPCGHLATCIHCALSLTHCQMCRQEIHATVRTFLS